MISVVRWCMRGNSTTLLVDYKLNIKICNMAITVLVINKHINKSWNWQYQLLNNILDTGDGYVVGLILYRCAAFWKSICLYRNSSTQNIVSQDKIMISSTLFMSWGLTLLNSRQ